MKRFFISVLAITILGAVASSCKDYMEFPPEGQVPQVLNYQNANDAEAGMVSMYAYLRSWDIAGGMNYLTLSELTSDNIIKGSAPGDGSWANAYNIYQFTKDEGQLRSFWRGRYQAIGFSNQIITKVPSIAMDQGVKDRYIAEAKFLRAYHYFNLVRAFGGVPIVDHVPVGPEGNIRRSAEETWDFIEKDLNESIAVLPDAVPSAELGRATKWAAKFLLAKTYLYREKWSQCKSLTDEFIASGKFSLYPNFYKLFRPEQEFCSESIFEIVSTHISGNDRLSNCQYSEIQGVRGQYGWGWYVPSDNLAAAFDAAGDVVRKKATILYRGDVTPDGDEIKGIEIMDGTSIPRYSGKAYVPSRFPSQYSGRDQNIRIMRFAEVLLMNAEAAIHTSSDAATSLNKVRTRVSLPAISNPTLQQIWNERRLELACEQDRFWDLVRTGQAASALATQGFSAGKINYSQSLKKRSI